MFVHTTYYDIIIDAQPPISVAFAKWTDDGFKSKTPRLKTNKPQIY
jgi:hypothetical protein